MEKSGKVQREEQEDLRVDILTQGLEGAGSFLGGTNRLEVQGQGWVMAHIRKEATFLQLAVGHLLLLQLTQFLH